MVAGTLIPRTYFPGHCLRSLRRILVLFWHNVGPRCWCIFGVFDRPEQSCRGLDRTRVLLDRRLLLAGYVVVVRDLSACQPQDKCGIFPHIRLLDPIL